MVNGMGGTPLIELYVVFDEVRRVVAAKGATIARSPGRQLHHQPRHGRCLDHRAAPHPGPDRALGRSGGDARAAVGALRIGHGRGAAGGRHHRPRLDRRRPARDIEENKDHLTHLDSAIGDADHGINLVRGFTAVGAALAEKQPATPGELLTLVGNTLISKVGGASGPLYGTAFRRAGKALGTEPDVSPEALGVGPAGRARRACRGSAPRPRATRRWSTRWHRRCAPTSTRWPPGAGIADAAQAAAAAAEKGAEATIPMQALKGRASYLGARSVGHQDPGATSTALLLHALAETLGGPGS